MAPALHWPAWSRPLLCLHSVLCHVESGQQQGAGGPTACASLLHGVGWALSRREPWSHRVSLELTVNPAPQGREGYRCEG